MIHDYLSPYSNDNKDDTFELLEQSQTGQRSNLDTIDDNMIRPASGLPAKQFPLRSATQTVRSTFWVGCLAVATITALSIVASKITNYIPDTSTFSPTDGVSCDLLFQNGSSFQHAFTIDLRGSTDLTFPQAKAIDVVWQLFVGMGGRLVMALVAYTVFMDGLARIMEDSAISYQLYASLTFSTTSLLTTGRAVKGVMATKGWRGKIFLAWFTISSIYVLGFPTLISATAGYLKPSTAGFRIDNSTFLTPDSPALKNCYEVNDGALIGLQNGTVVQGPPISQIDVVNGLFIGQDGNFSFPPNLQQDYPVFASLLNGGITSTLYSYTEKLTVSTEVSVNPPEPVYLSNSSKFNVSDPSQWNGEVLAGEPDYENFITNVTIVGHVYMFMNWSFEEGDAFVGSWCYNNQTLNDLPSMAECLPETYYVWGLSSLLLYIVLCLQMVWIFGMYFVWLDANIYTAICRSGRRMRGDFRAAADLSGAMEEVLGNETCAYSNDEMLSALNRESGVRYYATGANDNNVAHIGISSIRLGRVPYNSTLLYGERRKDQ